MTQLDDLKKILKSYGRVAIAYSGGCDSHFLWNVAIQTLGKENVLAVLCIGAMMSDEEKDFARELLKGYWYQEIPIDVLKIPQFQQNNRKRCYFCKKTMMTQVIEVAKSYHIDYVLDGKNRDDEGAYRPGIQACQELGILSPLANVHMTKQNVRDYSKQLGIVTFNKPANACLASRFDYDTNLTLEKLKQVEKGEALFHQIGIDHVRLRVQDELARIEIEKTDFLKVINNQLLIEDIKALGFQFVTLDLEGIRSGSYDK